MDRARGISYARTAALKSQDPSTKVGAYVESVQGGFEGWNDFPLFTPEHYWNDRETKYKYVCHAEVNAIMNAGYDRTLAGTLYVTAHPCRDCAKLISRSGVIAVVCPEGPWRDDPAIIETVADAKKIMISGGIAMDYIKEGE